MNYSAKPKYILISGDAVFFPKWGVTQVWTQDQHFIYLVSTWGELLCYWHFLP